MMAFDVSQLFEIEAKASGKLNVAESDYPRSDIRGRPDVFEGNRACMRLDKMHGNAPIHPRNGGHGKFKIARDYLAVIFQSVNDNVHAAGSVGCKADFLGFSIDKGCD